MNQNESDFLQAINRVENWQEKKIQYELVIGGITNPNWKITVEKKSYFVKIPGKGTEAYIDRENAHIANLIAASEKIGPKVYYYFDDTGVEIFEWLENYRTLNYGDVFNRKIFSKIIDTIRKFHQHEENSLPVKKNRFEQTFEMMNLCQKFGRISSSRN